MTTTRDKMGMSPVEVITSVSRRRRWSPREKRAMVEEVVPVSEVKALRARIRELERQCHPSAFKHVR